MVGDISSRENENIAELAAFNSRLLSAPELVVLA